jgi:hypothetical protein
MCDFLSFLIVTNGQEDNWKILSNPGLRHHEDIARDNDLKPGTYREAEWTGPDKDYLHVETEPEDQFTEEQYIAYVMARFPTRAALVGYLLIANKEKIARAEEGLDLQRMHADEDFTLPDDLVVNGSLDLSYTGIKKLPKGLVVKGNLYMSITHIKEYPADTQVEGDLVAWGMVGKTKGLPRKGAGSKRVGGTVYKDKDDF